MIRTRCDTRGRVYLRETLRSKFGEVFIVVEAGQGVLLLPVPKDPLDDLATLGRSLRDVSLAQIKKRAIRRAQEEVRV